MYPFISNHSKSISLIIILVLTIIITLQVYDSYSKKEGAAGIGDILNMIKCPMKIFKNFNTCMIYWITDIIFYVIWYIIWVCCLILFCIWYTLYMLLSYLLSTSIKKPFQQLFGSPSPPSMNDICPTKRTVMNSFETFYKLFSGEKFLYRDSGDIKKCYCAKPLEKFFQPLTINKPFTMSSISSPSIGNGFIVSVSILLLWLVLHNLKK